jgi:hypothetical protein
MPLSEANLFESMKKKMVDFNLVRLKLLIHTFNMSSTLNMVTMLVKHKRKEWNGQGIFHSDKTFKTTALDRTNRKIHPYEHPLLHPQH